jgi:hypothetical protein
MPVNPLENQLNTLRGIAKDLNLSLQKGDKEIYSPEIDKVQNKRNDIIRTRQEEETRSAEEEERAEMAIYPKSQD